jgi:hypothetical protein
MGGKAYAVYPLGADLRVEGLIYYRCIVNRNPGYIRLNVVKEEASKSNPQKCLTGRRFYRII